jgi:hypothetical protein
MNPQHPPDVPLHGALALTGGCARGSQCCQDAGCLRVAAHLGLNALTLLIILGWVRQRFELSRKNQVQQLHKNAEGYLQSTSPGT